MAPTLEATRSLASNTQTSNNPIRRAWKEDRIDLPASLKGRGQETPSTTRHTLEERLGSGRKSPPQQRSRSRQNSLKRVKNSNEVFRSRSTKNNHNHISRELKDATPTSREGRPFKVANVGDNGKIYLRPSEKPAKSHQSSVPVQPYNTPDPQHIDSDIDAVRGREQKYWSASQASITARHPPISSSNPRGRRSNSISGRSSILSRDSTSTISPEDALDPGAYRVVIKNGITRTQPNEQATGGLDITIPHYRLGTPRFSTRGTALITSTVYSRSSAADDLDIPSRRSTDIERVISPLDTPQPTSTNPLDTKELPPPPKGVPMRMPITTIAPVFHRAREPIVPAIYESLHSNPDDPSIVRYAMTTREISAASPARIVAQITSKSFLDYELLSDFFLTVRAYLSTNDLLDYLLARFEWAINRLDDEGRVIRVRSFAAIRHWVLNYFPYDFVVDRDLRVKFCERLNFLAKQVRKKGHEASDLKLIIDLKKCWNGRCALYWDNIGDEFETRIEHEISPGGIIGSRDSQLTHPNDLWAQLATKDHQPDQEKSVAALHNWVDSVIEAEVDKKSEKQPSVTSPVHTQSFQSEQSSIPATSCVIPSKTVKTLAQAGRHQGPHPVPHSLPPIPASARRACPPAPSSHSKDKVNRSKPDHNRSGSFSDALRDKRTSLGAIHEGKATEPVVMSLPFNGGLVRGSVVAPGSPFIDNHTQHGSGSSMKHGSTLVVNRSEKVTEQPMSPGVRNLLANLRRAWSKQQNVAAAASASTPSLIPPAPFVMETKHAGLPIHIAHKIEGFGDQHHQLEALKRGARIDLLCADVTDMFERAAGPAETKAVSAKSSVSKFHHEEEDDTSDWQQMPSPRHRLNRNPSEVTTGSRSIVIVDDTSSEPPVPSIPSPYNSNQSSHDATTMHVNIGTYTDPTANADQSRNVNSGQSSELLPEFTRPQFDPPRPSVAMGNYERTSTSLRKYASYQSGIGKRSERTSVTASVLESPEKARVPAGRLLRRVPGGDLKANENVHDMEVRPRRGSTGTIATFRESIRESQALQRMTGLKPPSSGTIARASTPVGRRSISLVNPQQSPKVRKSFEIAVAQFARIPDDERGDLEDTLAKLEGKFKSPKASSHNSRATSERSALHAAQKSPVSPLPTQSKNAGSKENVASPISPMSNNSGPQNSHGAPNQSNRSLYTASEGSYDPVPVVDRKAKSQASQGASAYSGQSNITVPRPLFSPKPPNNSHDSVSTDRTSEMGSGSRIRRGRCRSSIPTMTTDSFLLDEDESLSDISSDFDSDDDDDLTEDGETNSAVLEDAYGSSAKSMQGPYQSSSVSAMGSGHLPSPPMTTENAMSISSEARKQQEERKPPTPEPSPVSRMTEASTKSRAPNEVDSCVLQPFANKLHRFPPRRHLPFILSFEPEILAQQFTLIERDALNEINWQDLVDLKWSTTPSTILNWVEYLRFSDPNGIDLVIARANLMVKWAVSEIVLTHHVEERALTIMKLIRTAQAARKQCNYATMLQLTLALTSQDVQRLKKTWSCVPERERAIMKQMESLVSPVRNFWNLRHEMDAMDLDGGCIPVVALFLHDLTYNAQKPSVIASTRDSEPLINFERYRTTATIVKSLLRLVDASAKYAYDPVEGALERCLWIASLSDEGIRKRSGEIEG